MKLEVLQDERFSCHGCTDCCRHWHVQLIGDEAPRIAALDWGDGDPLHGREVLLTKGPQTFLRHDADGACVMLNRDTGRCRIHERFGEDAKPTGCRLFPFSLAPTFGNRVSVATRFTCPSVRRNAGVAHEEHFPELRKLAQRVVAGKGFDDEQMCQLRPEQVRAITEFAATLMAAFDRPAAKAVFLHALCTWLAVQPAESMNREALGEAFAELQEHVTATLDAGAAKPGAVHRLAFGAVWASHLRRDEDVLDRRVGRVARFLSLGRACLGSGDLQRLGHDHPAGSIRKARLFTGRGAEAAPEAFEVFWRMVRQKLASHQFMGAANFRRGMLEGLLDLCLLYPLVAASARYHAAARDAEAVGADDVDYATAAIERGFGRNAVLDSAPIGRLRMLLLRPGVYERLVLNL